VLKQKEVRYAVKRVLGDEQLTDSVFELVRNQSDY
jgi:hypothetical protein